MKRVLIPALALTLAAGEAALAQPKRSAPPPPAAPPAAGILFPCRSEGEVCFVGVVKDGKLVVLFTNDPKAEEAAGKPLPVAAGAADLSGNEGRVVMMTGAIEGGALAKAEIVDVASPLLAFAIKLNAGGTEEGPPEPPPPPRKKR